MSFGKARRKRIRRIQVGPRDFEGLDPNLQLHQPHGCIFFIRSKNIGEMAYILIVIRKDINHLTIPRNLHLSNQ